MSTQITVNITTKSGRDELTLTLEGEESGPSRGSEYPHRREGRVMSDLLREKTVTARKSHRCMTCNTTTIQPGETYNRQTIVNDGRVYDWVQCVECVAISVLVFDWVSFLDEGVGAEEYAEWASEHQDDPEHGQKARAHLARLAVPMKGEGQ